MEVLKEWDEFVREGVLGRDRNGGWGGWYVVSFIEK